jgi:transposase
MYLRHSVRRKDGKTHTYWRLVRSVRRGSKVFQETVAQLGELDASGRARAHGLALAMTGRRDQRELFEQQASVEVARVRVSEVRTENVRQFGEVWLGWVLWRALGLDEVCAELIPQGHESIAWATMAAILTIARLVEPSSELHIAEEWYRRTALDDVLGIPAEKINEDRLYRSLDRLLPHKMAIETHLRERLGRLFSLDYDLLLYDVTSTYFEGECTVNPLARRGHSRDHRPDCKQVCIALVVTREGIPLAHEIFEGNRVDVTTVEEIVGTMEARFGLAKRVWVMDRGMVSEENVAWLMKTGRRYLLGAARSELVKWKPQLLERTGWREVRNGVEVKLVSGPNGRETFILCRSKDRTGKEKAMHARFSARIEEALTTLGSRIRKSNSGLNKSAVERQIGRLLQKNSRAARRYRIELVDDASLPAGFRLDWSANPEWDEWARASEGCYVLRTNVTDWNDEDLWKTYIQLTEAEAAFRIHKSDLSIRPVWHHNEKRVRAHIFVCFLAYALWKTLEQWMDRAGIGRSPRTILEELRQLRSLDVVLPLDETPARELKIRCVPRPSRALGVLLDRLGLHPPERLRPAETFTEM